MTARQDEAVGQFGALAFDAIRELQREVKERDEQIESLREELEESRRAEELLRLHIQQLRAPVER